MIANKICYRRESIIFDPIRFENHYGFKMDHM